MVETIAKPDVVRLPLAPKNPLPYRQQLKAVRAFHTGLETLRDAGGPVTRLVLAPKWLMPPVVVATSPEGVVSCCVSSVFGCVLVGSDRCYERGGLG
jgi:hypothetical protein